MLFYQFFSHPHQSPVPFSQELDSEQRIVNVIEIPKTKSGAFCISSLSLYNIVQVCISANGTMNIQMNYRSPCKIHEGLSHYCSDSETSLATSTGGP